MASPEERHWCSTVLWPDSQGWPSLCQTLDFGGGRRQTRNVLRRSAQSMHGVSSGLHWCTVRQRQHEQKAGHGRRQSFAAGGPGILKWLCLAGSNQDVQQDTIHHRGMCLFKPRQSILDPGYINVGVWCFGCRRISTAHYAA